MRQAEKIVIAVGEREEAGREGRRGGGTKALTFKKPLKRNHINIYTPYSVPHL